MICHQKAIDLYRGSNDLDELVAEQLHNFAQFVQKTDMAEAKRLHTEALGIRQRLYGHTSSRVVDSLRYLSKLLIMKGDLKEAELMLLEAKDIVAKDRAVFAFNAHESSEVLKCFILLHKSRGEFDKIELMYEELAARTAPAEGKTRTKCCVAEDLEEFAIAFCEMGNEERAFALFGEALKTKEQSWRQGDQSLAPDYDRLAGVLGKMERFEDAARFYRKALEIRTDSLGDFDKSVVQNRENIARMLRAMVGGDTPLEVKATTMTLA
jgi:tetratricopeptide (TPR) repeat protein